MIKILTEAGVLAAKVPPLLLQAEVVAQSFMKGVHGRRRVGHGEAFWQFRPYEIGDSMRSIDWKQTAKRDSAHVRQTEWESAQALWLYRDATESMTFRSSRHLPTKQEYAEILLLALGMVALEAGERVGLLGVDMQPQSHISAIRQVYQHLPQQKILGEGARAVSSRSHAVLMSDFYFPPNEIIDLCQSLALRQIKGIVLQIFDPAEKQFPYEGRAKFKDIENTSATVTISNVESVRDIYQERFIAHQKTISDAVEPWGWRFLSVSTDTPYKQVLSDLYMHLGDR